MTTKTHNYTNEELSKRKNSSVTFSAVVTTGDKNSVEINATEVKTTYMNTLALNYLVPKVQAFKVGDVAEYWFYNNAYYARILKITAKTVVVDAGNNRGSDTTRMSISDFVHRNWDFDQADAEKRSYQYA